MPRVQTLEEFQAVGPGAYWEFCNSIWIRCPGCGHGIVLNLGPEGHGGYYQIIQSMPLTLEPMILHHGCWGGWLVKGEWVRQR